MRGVWHTLRHSGNGWVDMLQTGKAAWRRSWQTLGCTQRSRRSTTVPCQSACESRPARVPPPAERRDETPDDVISNAAVLRRDALQFEPICRQCFRRRISCS